MQSLRNLVALLVGMSIGVLLAFTMDAKAFPKTTKVVAEAPAPFSALDLYGAGAGAGVDLLTGIPALSLLAPGRLGARYGLMTQPGQRLLATPQYTPRTTPFVPYQGLLNIQE